jgi:hypothetical protein
MARRSVICFALLLGLIPSGQAQAPAPVSAAGGAVAPVPTAGSGLKTYTVPAGTRILLSLKQEISTRVAKPGDPTYFVSEFPVVQEGVVVIPAGMYVKGVIDSVQRPGKVKGRAQLQMHFASMIFPNGVEIAIPGSLDDVPGSTNAKVKNSEGTVEAAGTKGRDAQRIGDAAGAGAGVGTLAGMGTGHVGLGSGIGGGAGAAVGILATMMTRGNDVVFPAGTTLEMVLARPLNVQQDQLSGMPGSTGMNMPMPTAPQPMPAASPKPND